MKCKKTMKAWWGGIINNPLETANHQKSTTAKNQELTTKQNFY